MAFWFVRNGHPEIMSTALAIMALGLFLGDAARHGSRSCRNVTTIVSRERTILSAAIIGALWGLGHTVTILVVGSAIILLKLDIPLTLGLEHELSVACMLILLGAMNLIGLTRRAMEWLAARRYGPGAHAHAIFGRVIVHTHGGTANSVGPGEGAIFDWAPQWFRKLGLFHVFVAAGRGNCSWPRRIGRVALLVLTTISRPAWAIGYLLALGSEPSWA